MREADLAAARPQERSSAAAKATILVAMALVPERIRHLVISSLALRPNGTQECFFSFEASVPVAVGLTRP
jgi:hypothetical protein